MVADVGLGQAGFHHRKAGTALRGNGLARSVVGEVVDVHPEDHGGRLGIRYRDQHVHEGVLAATTAVGVVHPVRGVGHLVGLHLRPAEPPLVGEGGGIVPLVTGQGGRHGCHHVHPVGTESVVGDPGQEGRVGAPGEGHHDPAKVAKGATQAVHAGTGHLRPGDHGQRRPIPASTVSRSATIPA